MSQRMEVLLIGLLFPIASINYSQAQSITHSAADIQGQEVNNATRLRCWHCSSDTIGSEDFCGLTFREDKIPTDKTKQQNFQVFSYCNYTRSLEHSRPICRKTIEEKDGKTVVKRFCYHKSTAEPLDYCKENSTSLLCFDCATDSCNGASKITTLLNTIIVPHFSVFGTILTPILISKILIV